MTINNWSIGTPRVDPNLRKATPSQPFKPTGFCDSTYHERGRGRPNSIAVLTRIKGAANRINEVHERCYDHVVNQLTYWLPFWKVVALDEEELVSAERTAARARAQQGSGRQAA